MGFWNYCWYVVCLDKIVRLLDGWLDVWGCLRGSKGVIGMFNVGIRNIVCFWFCIVVDY